MTVVVDLGCKTQSGEESIDPLIERFRPAKLFGYDPLAQFHSFTTNGTEVVIHPKAAWVTDAKVRFSAGGGIDATVMPESARWVDRRARYVPCFDFSAWLTRNGPAVVKMDIEGAEFPVLEKMIADRTDRLVEVLLIEWHERFLDGYQDEPARLTEALACKVESWH